VWVALNWKQAEAAPGDPPPAVLIELAPLAVAPEARPQEVAPGPQMTEAQPDPTPDAPNPVEDAKPDPTPPPPEKTVEDAKPDPAPPVTPPEPPPPDLPLVPTSEREVKVPELPRQEHADAMLAPSPAPAPAPAPEVQKKPPPKNREVERKKPVRPDTQKVRQTTAPPTSEAHHSNAAASPSAGGASASSVSPASWKGELMAHLNRYKRYPSGAGVGTASIAFTISRSGEVLSARLIGSSGDSALDEEAVALIRRASPVPAPPPEVGGGSIPLTVPIRFNR
jgi:periplasmic protein TonB